MKKIVNRWVHNAFNRRGLSVTRLPQPLIDHPENILKVSFDQVLSRHLLWGGSPSFLQVGAFNGVFNDPIYPFVKRGLLKGCLVEPQPDAFEQLQFNYQGVEGLVFLNAAIGTQAGTQLLYRVKPGTEGPTWIRGLATFNKEILLRHCKDHPGLAESVVAIEVPTITAEMACSQLEMPPEIVVIDTEGFDYEVLKLLDIAKLLPKIIFYEYKHLSISDRESCLEMLIRCGYHIALNGDDTIATRMTPADT